MIRAIETAYNGYLFRSRLEARWAVFFDQAGVEYEYEFEGFDLDGVRYLPDFWLPKFNLIAEIKPSSEIPEDEREKILALAKHLQDFRGPWASASVNVFCGAPWADHEEVHYRTLWVCQSASSIQLLPGRDAWCVCPLCRTLRYAPVWKLSTDEWAIYCERCDMGKKMEDRSDAYFYKGDVAFTGGPAVAIMNPLLAWAYQKSRSARFEFSKKAKAPRADEEHWLRRCLGCLRPLTEANESGTNHSFCLRCVP